MTWPPEGDAATLESVLLACLQAQEEGRADAEEEAVARYPHLAADVRAFLADRRRLAAILDRGETTAQEETPGRREQGDPLPREFGSYEILEELGRGGMGVVFKARQKGANRLVALKTTRAELASDTETQRFRSEAEAVAGLEHENIVPVYEVGGHEGRAFFTMKLVEGGSLAQRRGNFAEPRAAAHLVAVLARAVHHAHQRGVLHRDLKPANVLIDGDGKPYVADFGLARRIDAEDGPTLTGQILGSPSYMAPEQAEGQRGTTQTDVYGLGAILYFLLTGRPPFEAGSIGGTLALVRRGRPVPPREVNRRVDPDLEAICLKCLEKEPSDRYASPEDLADDLERFLAGLSVRPRPLGFWDWLVQTLRKRPEPSPDYSWHVPIWQGGFLFAQHGAVALVVAGGGPLWVVWALLLAGWAACLVSMGDSLRRFRPLKLR